MTALKGDDDVSTDGVVLERERWVHASEPGERADETSLFVCKEALILVPFMFAGLMRGVGKLRVMNQENKDGCETALKRRRENDAVVNDARTAWLAKPVSEGRRG